MQNGKGDTPRHNLSRFSIGYDSINWAKDDPEPEILSPRMNRAEEPARRVRKVPKRRSSK